MSPAQNEPAAEVGTQRDGFSSARIGSESRGIIASPFFSLLFFYPARIKIKRRAHADRVTRLLALFIKIARLPRSREPIAARWQVDERATRRSRDDSRKCRTNRIRLSGAGRGGGGRGAVPLGEAREIRRRRRGCPRLAFIAR